MNRTRKLIIYLVFFVMAACSNDEPQDIPASDLLGLLDARATSGAAAGYVGDAVCQNCHLEKAQSYQTVGMSQSFGRPGTRNEIEEFGTEYYHEASQRYFQILKNGDRLTFHRYQRDKNDDIGN